MSARYNIPLLCRTALFAAIIFVFTAYLHVPSHTGYTHVGDAFVYLAACLLPGSYGAAAGAIGAGLADLLSGYAIWAPGTVIIKAVTALLFSREEPKIITPRNLLALPGAWLVCILGYWSYDALLTGSWAAAAAGIPGYVTQAALSSAVYISLGLALDRAKVSSGIADILSGRGQ